MFRRTAGAVALLLGFSLAVPAWAEDFTARLGRVPVDSRTQSTVAGIGHATAALDGNRLVIEGEFEGLLGPATIANLHMGRAVGVRGPAIHELNVSGQSDGEVTAELRLNAAEIAGLQAGRAYIQIHSEIAPDGNLWGWLFMD